MCTMHKVKLYLSKSKSSSPNEKGWGGGCFYAPIYTCSDVGRTHSRLLLFMREAWLYVTSYPSLFKLQMKWNYIHLPTVYSLTHLLTCSLTHSLTHSPTHSLTNSPPHLFTSVPLYQCTIVPVYQCTVPVYQCTSVPVYQCTSVLH